MLLLLLSWGRRRSGDEKIGRYRLAKLLVQLERLEVILNEIKGELSDVK